MPRRNLLWLILLLALALGSNALAGGQAFCRLETSSSFTVRCAVEQAVMALGPLEVMAGLSVRYQPPSEPLVALTAYTALILRLESWWLELDIVAGLQQGFGFAIAGGFSWS